jgi:hypothetical protein
MGFNSAFKGLIAEHSNAAFKLQPTPSVRVIYKTRDGLYLLFAS